MQRNDSQRLNSQHDNLINDHSEVANHIKQFCLLPKLPIADIGHLGQLSTQWYGFMSNDANWQWLIARDFGIPIEVMAKFIQVAKYIDPNLRISFAEIYRCLFSLSKQKKPGMRSLIEFCRQPDRVFLLLACCLNSESSQTLLQAIIPRDEVKWWTQFSVIASANRTTKTLLQSFGFDQWTIYRLKKLVTQLGNVELTRHLIKLKLGDPALDIVDYFCVGISGNIELFEYMLSVGRFGFNPRDTLLHACINGHAEMARYLIKKYHITPNKELLDAALESGNLELVFYLTSAHDLKPDKKSLEIAASFGHFELVHHLISNFLQKPDAQTFSKACLSGNETLTYYFIKEHHWVPSKDNLDCVAKSGNYELFTRLLHEYPQIPDAKTLHCAISSGSFELFQLLVGEYRLIPDIHSMTGTVPGWNMTRFLMDTYQLELDEEVRNNIIDRVQNLDDMFPEISLIIKARLAFIHIDPLPTDPDGHEYRDNGMKAYQALQRAILHLRNAEIEAAIAQWQQAAEYSSRQFFTFAVMAVGNPKQFNLAKDHVTRLIEVMGDAVFIPHTLIEREAIYKLLSSATDERLKVLASAFTPPPIQPIFFANHIS